MVPTSIPELLQLSAAERMAEEQVAFLKKSLSESEQIHYRTKVRLRRKLKELQEQWGGKTTLVKEGVVYFFTVNEQGEPISLNALAEEDCPTLKRVRK